MNILDTHIQDDLRSGKPLKLELGSGGPGKTGFYGVDMLPLPGVAIQADLNEPLDLLPDNSVESIYSQHCLEHLNNFMGLMREVYRVLRPGGIMEALVPHFSNPYYYSDPTHVRFFGLYTFYYFADTDSQPQRKVPCFYSDVRFHVQRTHIHLQQRSMWQRLRYPRLGSLVNRSFEWQDWWERKLCWRVPAAAISYWVQPVK